MKWMPAPQQAVPGCPPGLEYLTQIDQILVHQQVEVLEALTGWETRNRYRVRNTLGQDVYYAVEGGFGILPPTLLSVVVWVGWLYPHPSPNKGTV